MNDPLSVSTFCTMKYAFTQSIGQQGEILISKLMGRIEHIGNIVFKTHLRNILCNVMTSEVDYVKYREERDPLHGFATHQELIQALENVKQTWNQQIDMQRTDEGYLYSPHISQPGENPETLLFAQVVHGDRVYTGDFDEDSFMEAIMFALHNGRDPIRALGILADEGAAKLDRRSPTWTNAFGT